MRKIKLVPQTEKNKLLKMFNQYLTELSEFDSDIKFDKNKTPVYKWFDFYWANPDRFPFYFLVDNVARGFCLLREKQKNHYDIAEFFILPEFRKDDNAIWFASEITKQFPGRFDFGTRLTNKRAIKFWSKFANLFKENFYVDDEIQRNWTIKT